MEMRLKTLAMPS